MALNRNTMNASRRYGRPSFWERPSRALPDRKGCPLVAVVIGRPAVGLVNDAALCTALQPHCRQPSRAVASPHEGEWRCTPPRSKEGRASDRVSASGLLLAAFNQRPVLDVF